MVNLTTLAPDIVAAILDETLPPEVTLFDLAAGTPLLWEGQWGRVEDSRLTTINVAWSLQVICRKVRDVSRTRHPFPTRQKSTRLQGAS
jgi:hypothetical protein